MPGFKKLRTASAAIVGFELVRALRKGQAAVYTLTQDIRGEARIAERAFSLGASALAEAVAPDRGKARRLPCLTSAAERHRGLLCARPNICNRDSKMPQ